MKLYEGKRLDRTIVTVDGRPLDPCNDIYNHSPTGFEWGYVGSGCAQLALAIVADHLSVKVVLCTCEGIPPAKRFAIHHEENCELGKRLEHILRHYQRFKELFVARFEKDAWVLKEEDVRIALIELENERKAREKLGNP